MNKDQEVQERILAAAGKRFFTEGFTTVTMDDMARELGMSKKTLYRLFASKDELLRAVMQRFVAEVEAATDQILENPDTNCLSKLHRLLGFIAMQMLRIRPPFLLDLQRSAHPIWAELDEWRRRRVISKFAVLIEQGVAEGVFRNDLNKELLLRMYTLLIQGIVNPEVLSQLPLTAHQAFEHVSKVFFEGVLTERARTEQALSLSTTEPGEENSSVWRFS